MELIELQAIWQQYDKNISENTRLNKEILRRMLISKPEKRLNWMKGTAVYSLVLPIVIILLVLVPHIEYRSEIDFFVGASLFGVFYLLHYYWSIKYYMLLRKINFTNPITLIKKSVNQLEKYKLRVTKLAYILIPFGIVGIFLMGKFPVLSKDSLLPISLIILVMIISIYYTFKYSIFERFKKINTEIEEIEQLEKE
jgi:amino acid transporter